MSSHPTESEAAPRGYRFASFEVDVRAGELRRQGIRLKLNAQPFQLLLLLLERPGEVVTREEICRALWPDGTFVDYEHGVNSALNRLREALNDTAGNPRYVETLARRGYRFLLPVERIEDLGETPPVPPPVSAETGGPEAEAEATLILASTGELPRASTRLVTTLFLLLQGMYAAMYIGALANLAEIDDLLSALHAWPHTYTLIVVTSAVLLPVRAFAIFLVTFHAPGVREKFLRLWPVTLLADILWSASPFLLLHHINFGLALAATAILVYSPFAQRALVLMGAGSADGGKATRLP